MKIKQIFHPWTTWECYQHGFFNTRPPKGLTKEECEEGYREFLSDLQAFEQGILEVFSEWTHSCEQFLTAKGKNHIAWVGQSACCAYLGIPSVFRGGYRLLTSEQQRDADQLADNYIQLWREAYAKNEHRTVFKKVDAKRVS